LRENNYPVVVKTYQLTIWYIKKLQSIPKNHRFTIGEKIQDTLLTINLNLVDAIYSKDKRELLLQTNREIEKLRLLSRLLKDLEIIKPEKHLFISQSIDEIGSMVGGWLKSV
jgi:hypothetical protein